MTVEATTSAACVVRRLPVRASDPPYDDELPVPPAPAQRSATQGALALAFPLPGAHPAPQPLSLVPPPEEEKDWGHRPTPVSELPDVGAWAARFVQAALEVLTGHRAPGQLVRWTTSEVYDDMTAASARVARAATRRRPRPVVRSVHVSCPTGTAAEVCALVQTGPRVRAVALRLEGLDGRWQCTVLRVA